MKNLKTQILVISNNFCFLLFKISIVLSPNFWGCGENYMDNMSKGYSVHVCDLLFYLKKDRSQGSQSWPGGTDSLHSSFIFLNLTWNVSLSAQQCSWYLKLSSEDMQENRTKTPMNAMLSWIPFLIKIVFSKEDLSSHNPW